MNGLGKFTQYYLVSIIFPGLFNAGIIYFAVRRIDLIPELWSLTRWEQAFLLLFFVVITLLVGMRIEKAIFSVVRFASRWQKAETITSYDTLATWREQLLVRISDDKRLRSLQLVAYVEKLMSEYYFLNNIIPGIIISSVILLLFLPHADTLCSVGLRVSVLAITFFLLWLIGWVMRIWLGELHILLSSDSQQ